MPRLPVLGRFLVQSCCSSDYAMCSPHAWEALVCAELCQAILLLFERFLDACCIGVAAVPYSMLSQCAGERASE